jgi:hypothetical protein
MSYIEDILQRDERILYDAPVSKFMYVSSLIAFAVSMWPKGIFSIHKTRIVLTDKRLIGTTGFLGGTTLALPHAKVMLVKVSQGFPGNYLDYGTVTVISTDGAKTKFKGILWPLMLQREVEDAVEMATLGRKLSDHLPLD